MEHFKELQDMSITCSMPAETCKNLTGFTHFSPQKDSDGGRGLKVRIHSN
jgi:hypothetical protein